MGYQVLARKWRPKTFAQVVGQTHVTKGLQHALSQNHLHHAYLFTGTRGVGKTTLARLFAKAVNCEQGIGAEPCGECSACTQIDAGRFVDLIEIDAASRTKVEDTRDLLDNVPYAPVAGRFKIYLIDEVHMLSTHSFNALLKTLEEPPEHVKFLLATTDPQKLPVTILSRCLEFHLQPLSVGQIKSHLAAVLDQEKIEFETESLETIAFAAKGSVRDALTLLDQIIAAGQGTVNADAVQAVLNLASEKQLITLFTAVASHDAQVAYECLQQMLDQGITVKRFYEQSMTLLTRVALCQQNIETVQNQALNNLAQILSAATVQVLHDIIVRAQTDLAHMPDEASAATMTVLRLLAFQVEIGEAGEGPTSSAVAPLPVKESRTVKPVDVTVKTESQPAIENAFPRPGAEAQAQVRNKSSVLSQPQKKVSPPSEPAVSSATAEQAPAQPMSSPISSSNVQGIQLSALSESTWLSEIKKMDLTGITKQIVHNTQWQASHDNKLDLKLKKTYERLLTQKIQDQLQTYWRKYFNIADLIVNIAVSDTVSVSTAQVKEHENNQQKQDIQHAIKQDKNIDFILDEFSGKIVKESVQQVIKQEDLT